MANDTSQAGSRDRGNLFDNKDKKKPSQPDMFGDCVIASVPYELRGWKRADRLEVSLAPPRGDSNTYPPDVFHGWFDAAPPRPVARPSKRGPKEPVDAGPPVPAWSGDIVSTEVAYTVRAMEKQGKSGLYYTLSFEKLADIPQVDPMGAWVDPDDADPELGD